MATLTITVGNLPTNPATNTNVGLFFNSGGTGTCTTVVSGGATQTLRLMSNLVTCAVPGIASGTRTITVSNVTIGATSFAITTNIDNIISVSTTNSATWGLGTGTTPTLTSLADAFTGGTNLVSVPDDIPSTVLNVSSMFEGCIIFNGITTNSVGVANGTITNWGIQNVNNMENMFKGCSLFNNNGVALWNNNSGLRSTSSVNNMLGMFRDCNLFNVDIGNWNTSSVTTMVEMFQEANAFNIDIGGWDTSNVSDMSNMFNASNPSFTKNIRYWTIRSSTLLEFMFPNPSPFSTLYYDTLYTEGWWPVFIS
jgi:surface protein